MFVSLKQPNKRDDENVMRKRVAQLMPPVLADDLALVDLVDAPEMSVPPFIEEDGLEDVIFECDFGRELGLVVGAVEAHFELGAVFGVFFDVVHWFERFLGHLYPAALVNARERGDGLIGVVEVFVVAFHVLGVAVGDGDIIREFC